MNYDAFFADQLDQLRAEGNYRVFAELEREATEAPHATMHGADKARPVTVWCSRLRLIAWIRKRPSCFGAK